MAIPVCGQHPFSLWLVCRQSPGMFSRWFVVNNLTLLSEEIYFLFCIVVWQLLYMQIVPAKFDRHRGLEKSQVMRNPLYV